MASDENAALPGRRTILAGMAATALIPAMPAFAVERSGMHGLIGKMRATPGQREALIAILLQGTEEMPGCLSYVVARDTADPDAIWVTEIWDSAESHKASLSLPGVKAAIAKGRPLIAGFDNSVTTEPVGGWGPELR